MPARLPHKNLTPRQQTAQRQTEHRKKSSVNSPGENRETLSTLEARLLDRGGQIDVMRPFAAAFLAQEVWGMTVERALAILADPSRWQFVASERKYAGDTTSWCLAQRTGSVPVHNVSHHRLGRLDDLGGAW